MVLGKLMVARLLKQFPAVCMSHKYCTAVARAFCGKSVQHKEADHLL